MQNRNICHPLACSFICDQNLDRSDLTKLLPSLPRQLPPPIAVAVALQLLSSLPTLIISPPALPITNPFSSLTVEIYQNPFLLISIAFLPLCLLNLIVLFESVTSDLRRRCRRDGDKIYLVGVTT